MDFADGPATRRGSLEHPLGVGRDERHDVRSEAPIEAHPIARRAGALAAGDHAGHAAGAPPLHALDGVRASHEASQGLPRLYLPTLDPRTKDRRLVGPDDPE